MSERPSRLHAGARAAVAGAGVFMAFEAIAGVSGSAAGYGVYASECVPNLSETKDTITAFILPGCDQREYFNAVNSFDEPDFSFSPDGTQMLVRADPVYYDYPKRSAFIEANFITERPSTQVAERGDYEFYAGLVAVTIYIRSRRSRSPATPTSIDVATVAA